jgi:hypothetical protein
LRELECDVGITGGDTVITGDFTEQEAKDLALLIRAGTLSVIVEVIEQRTRRPLSMIEERAGGEILAPPTPELWGCRELEGPLMSAANAVCSLIGRGPFQHRDDSGFRQKDHTQNLDGSPRARS